MCGKSRLKSHHIRQSKEPKERTRSLTYRLSNKPFKPLISLLTSSTDTAPSASPLFSAFTSFGSAPAFTRPASSALILPPAPGRLVANWKACVLSCAVKEDAVARRLVRVVDVASMHSVSVVRDSERFVKEEGMLFEGVVRNEIVESDGVVLWQIS